MPPRNQVKLGKTGRNGSSGANSGAKNAWPPCARSSPLPAPWTVTLDVNRVQQRKFEAFRAHTSQLPLMERFQSYFEKRAGTEFYTLAATPHPQPAVQSTDLFAGLVE